MSAAKHTPGPWKIELADERHAILLGINIVSGRNNEIACVAPRRSAVANAHLIAAAPVLADALAAAVLVLEGDTSGDALVAAIRAGHAALRAAGRLP